MIYDCAIVGTGPAGLSAALNLKIHNKNFIWIGNKNLSDKIQKAEQIQNYPGFINVSGQDLNKAFQDQVAAMDIEIKDAMVNNIMPFGNSFALMAGSEFFQALTVILTTGVTMRNTLAGEDTLLGRGVSYCATCDGGLYRGRRIAVISTNPRFDHEVRFLSELAERIYYFPTFADPQPVGRNVLRRREKVKEIIGEERVTGVKTADGDIIDVDGVFILRDSISLSALLPKLETENGHIKVTRQMETSIPGVFAAGDCTGTPYQYTKAVGEGNVAAHSVLKYLG